MVHVLACMISHECKVCLRLPWLPFPALVAAVLRGEPGTTHIKDSHDGNRTVEF